MDRKTRLLLESLLVAGLLAVGLLVLGRAARAVELHGDEGVAIAAAPYFSYLFLERNVTRPEWGDNYTTHTHPMIGRYLVGGSLWLHGYDLRRLPRAYIWDLSREENRRQGRVPSDAMLLAARLPMVFCAAAAIVLVYGIGRTLGGVLAGLAASTLALASPLVQEHLVRARPDAPLALFFLLALLLALVGVWRRRDGGLPVGWAIGTGAALGLAIGTKLTAVLSVAAILSWGVLVAVLAAIRPSRQVPDMQSGSIARGWSAGRGWALSLVVAGGIFILSNPHLYPDPVRHTVHLFQDRIEEGQAGHRARPELAIATPLAGAAFVLRGSLFSGTATGSLGVPLEALLVMLGVASLIVTGWRDWRGERRLSPVGLALVTAAAYVVGTSVFLDLPWERYLAPTLLLGTVFSGVAVAELARRAAAVSAGVRRPGLGSYRASAPPSAPGR